MQSNVFVVTVAISFLYTAMTINRVFQLWDSALQPCKNTKNERPHPYTRVNRVLAVTYTKKDETFDVKYTHIRSLRVENYQDCLPNRPH
jgi:hypothetical protein